MAAKKRFLTGQDQPKRHILRRLWNKKIIAVAIIVIIILAVLIFGLRKINHNTSSQKNVATNQCNYTNDSPLYNQAVSAMSTGKVDDINNVVEMVKKQTDYQKDPNCLFILMFNDLNRLKVDEAKNDFARMKENYSARKGIAKVFDKLGVHSLDSAKQYMNAKIKSINAIEKNSIFIPSENSKK